MQKDYNWHHIFLADDDADDRIFFTEALAVIYPGLKLNIEPNGDSLLMHLNLQA